MTAALRSWWRNCALKADSEILAIDGMEDAIAPLDEKITKIRELISSLELCHHKAGRWVDNIIAAIGAGETQKGLGTRPPGQRHSAEKTWENACSALALWCAGRPADEIESSLGPVSVSRMTAVLGPRSPLKEWQVQRVIEKIRSLLDWPRPLEDPELQYQWLLLSGGEYESAYRNQCPECYRDREEFWLQTVRTMIHDTENGSQADLSLGLAIDMLWPCHWNFMENLQIVLEAIGGKLHARKPFAACGRNIRLLPDRGRMEGIADSLEIFCGTYRSNREDQKLMALLGEPAKVKQWLAASLAKTIRLQLNPPAELRAMSALTGPDWIKQ